MSAVRRQILVGLALCLTAITLAGLLNRRNDLLARSTRINLADGLITNERTYAGYHHRYHHVPSYAWVSDTTVVSVRGAAEGGRELVQLDLKAGKVIGKDRSGQTEGEPLSGSFYWSFSASGHRVLSLSDSGSKVVCTVWTLEGGRQRSWTNRIDGSFDPTWLADGSGFILWYGRVGTVRARLHEVESGMVREFRLEQLRVEEVANPGRLNPRRVQVPGNLQSSDSAAEFLEIREVGGELTAARRRVRSPDGLRTAAATVYASPAGDRLAWLAAFEGKIPEFKRTSAFPFLSAQRRSTYRLFVSALDGSGLTQLGPFWGDEEIGEIAWTPDGKRLSFVRDSALWTVQTDRP